VVFVFRFALAAGLVVGGAKLLLQIL
jgi:hypothetical protein